MITISGASNRWKDNCSKLLYFTYNYQVPSRVEVKGIVHIVRTWAASTQGATGNRTQKAVCFFALFLFFNRSIHKHMLRARCNRNTSPNEMVFIKCTFKIHPNCQEVGKVSVGIVLGAYIHHTSSLHFDRTMWMSDICILNDWSVK